MQNIIFFEWECRWTFYFISILLFIFLKFTFFLVANLIFQKPKVNSKNENWENWLYKALNFSSGDQHNNRNETSVVLQNSYSEEEYLQYWSNPVALKSWVLLTGLSFSVSAIYYTQLTCCPIIHKEFFQKVEPLLVLQVEST